MRWPRAGRYVVAVSGGCDSMVLLDVLAGAALERDYELVVAHFDHGMRPDSKQDQAVVEAAAGRYGLPVITQTAHLGRTNEAAARTARHAFLEQVRLEYEAVAVVTAHHQDDLIETSLLNLARGAGRRGLAPMQDARIRRPFLNVPQRQIREYAHQQAIVWREDSTNEDRSNPRNFVRHELLQVADAAWRKRYMAIIDQVTALNRGIEADLSTLPEHRLSRVQVRDLSLIELEAWLRAAALQLQPGLELDTRLICELALFAKTARSGRSRPLRAGLEVRVNRAEVEICGL